MAVAVTYSEAVNELYAVVAAGFADACTAAGMIATGPILYDMTTVDAQPPSAPAGLWARVAHSQTAGTSRAVGGRLWRIEGAAVVAVFAPLKIYERRAGSVAETAADVVASRLRRHRGPHLVLPTVFATVQGVDATAYRADVNVSFRYDTAEGA